MYKDGTFVSTVTTGSTINHVTGTLIANIGALRTPTKYAVTAATGSGKLSGSLDDFRYWKTRRTSRDIGRYYIDSNDYPVPSVTTVLNKTSNKSDSIQQWRNRVGEG